MHFYTATVLALAALFVMSVSAGSDGSCKDDDGTVYGDGESFKNSDGCNDCFCSNGVIGCTYKMCIGGGCDHKGNRYAVGESFMDECNKCRCTRAGVAACTRKFCPVCRANGEEYKVGESYTAEDGCNTCTCSARGIGVCTLMTC